MTCGCVGNNGSNNTFNNGCNCGSLNNCCGGVQVPFYDQACAVQQCHEQPIVQQYLVAALSVGCDFAMPACNQEAVVFFYNLHQLQIGSYLWNATYGYLRVTYFNDLNGETHLVNDCQSGNAAPGVFIPRCTLFNVSVPPAIFGGYTYIFPAPPCPIPPGDPLAFDIVSIIGTEITLAWHAVPIVP